jgi:Ca2+-binding RTX toxin-like protein
MKRRFKNSFSLRPSRKPRRFKAKRNLSGFETLEKREVMAANIMAAFSNGVLYIEGTPSNDTIMVRNDGNKVSVDGALIANVPSIPSSSVNTILINGLAGHDTIQYLESNTAFNRLIPTTITGGWGNDTIKGGFGADKINGLANDFDTAERFDNDLGLHAAPEGDYYNWGGKQEKWLKGGSSSWYFITPDGSLYRQTQAGAAVGALVYKFDPSYHLSPDLLYEAGSGTNAAELDKQLNFVFDGNESLNWGGKQEKWFRSSAGAWHFITPDGTVYRQTQSGSATGVQVGKFDPSYWANINKIINAYERFADADTISGMPGSDTISGGADVDTISGGDGGDTINGNAGDDILWGGYLNNSVEQSYDDADTMYGGKGNDQMRGGGATDKIYGDTGVDYIWGDSGNDYLYGGADADTIYGGDDNDEIWGGYGIDTLSGGNHNDRLYGEMDFDYLYGQAGDDWLDAGSAGEYVNGGTNTNGAPERDIDAWKTTPNQAAPQDVIKSNGGTDYIVSAMAAVARTEDLSKRITYTGGNMYRVNLYQRNDLQNESKGYYFRQEYVYFDGSRFSGSDPEFNGQEGETWMIIMHRAIIQAISKYDPTNTVAAPNLYGIADYALGHITGKRGPYNHDRLYAYEVANLLSAGKSVILRTGEYASSLRKNNHYAVLSMNGTYATLLDPRGYTVRIDWNASEFFGSRLIYA